MQLFWRFFKVQNLVWSHSFTIFKIKTKRRNEQLSPFLSKDSEIRKKERGGLGCARELEPFSMSASEAVNSATTPSTAGTVSGVKSANSLQTSNQSPQVS